MENNQPPRPSEPHPVSTSSGQPSTQTRIHVVFAALGSAIILGMLMAVPACNNWMHERQARGAQTTARADLDLIFRRETDFKTKNGFYTTDLAALSLYMPKQLMVLYKFGFVAQTNDAGKKATALSGEEITLDPSRSNLDLLKKALPKLEVFLSGMTKLDDFDFSNMGSYCADCTATADRFKAVAAANLDNDPTLDVWTIDQNGVVVHVVDDLGTDASSGPSK